ncbi:MAG: hypothetical protein B6D63_05500 [Candidatus Latescibacteria bacterium 4484_7]|nr:MAG: hypothetical protein B6D63_05500 [Candidatus Latescibacteria bacterium 4484_7]
MKKLLIILLALAIFAGCKTTLKINNKTDPQSIDSIVLVTPLSHYYNEVEIDVPEEIRGDDYDVTRADMFADITASELTSPVFVRLFVGLESGEANIDDATRNELVAADTIDVGEVFHVAVKSPPLVLKALNQDRFYIKAVVTTAGPTAGYVNVDNIYLDIWLEKETSGLFPFFYLF